MNKEQLRVAKAVACHKVDKLHINTRSAQVMREVFSMFRKDFRMSRSFRRELIKAALTRHAKNRDFFKTHILLVRVA